MERVLQSSSDKELVRWCVHQLTVRALIASIAGRNTYALRVLVKSHQLYVHVFKDRCASRWILRHLTSIVSRIENSTRIHPISGGPRGLTFDELADMLQGFFSMGNDEVFNDEVEHLLKGDYSRVWSPTAEILDEMLAPQSEGWVAYYIGQSALRNDLKFTRLEKCMKLVAPWGNASELKEHVTSLLLRYLFLRLRLHDSLEGVEELVTGWFLGSGSNGTNAYSVREPWSSLSLITRLTGGKDPVTLYQAGRTFCETGMFLQAKEVSGMLNKVQAAKETSLHILHQGLAEKLNGFMAFNLRQDSVSLSHNYKAISLLSQLPTDIKKNELDFLLGISAASPDPEIVDLTNMAISNAWTQIAVREPDPRKAAQARLKTRKAVGRDGDNPWLLLQSKQASAERYVKNGKLEEAERSAAEVLSLASMYGSSHWRARALILLAEITSEYHAAAFGEYAYHIIESFLDEAEQIARQAHPRLLQEVLSDQATNHLRIGNLDKGIQKHEEVSTNLVQMDFGSFSMGRLSYLHVSKRTLRVLQTALILRNFQSKDSDSDSEGPITKAHEALIWAERGRCRDLLYNIQMPEQRESYLGELAEFDRNKVAAWKEIEDIVRLSSPRTAFLVLTVVDNKICGYALAWNPEDLEREVNWTCFIRSFTSERSVAQLVQETISNIKSNCGWQNYLQIWYHLFIAPCKHLLDALCIERLIIVPQEEISVLPFGAFYEEGQPFLIEQYAISCVPSLRMYRQCMVQQEKLKQRQCQSEGVRHGLVVGNPTAGGESLEASERESSFVAEKLEESGYGVTFLLRDEATKQSAMELLPQSAWVHIASHAVVNREYPCGALVLASNPSPSLEGVYVPGEDSKVARYERHLETLVRSTARSEMLTGEDLELAGHPLQATVAVLSACSTGLGRIFSDGVIGLSRSLHMLGVSSVVVSLWNVADDSTSILMERMYNHLHTEGLDVAKALQKATISMIREEDEDDGTLKYSPYHWAPFIISGSDLATI